MALLEFMRACEKRSRPQGAFWDQEEHESCSRPRVAGIMRELGLQGKRKGIIRKKTTNSNHALEVAQNKLERQFKAEKPNQKWVADLTYIPTLEGWLFLRE